MSIQSSFNNVANSIAKTTKTKEVIDDLAESKNIAAQSLYQQKSFNQMKQRQMELLEQQARYNDTVQQYGALASKVMDYYSPTNQAERQLKGSEALEKAKKRKQSINIAEEKGAE